MLGGALGAGVGGAALLGLAGGLVAWRAHRRRRGPSVPFMLPPQAVPLAQLRRVASRVSQSRVGPAPLPRSSYSRLGNPDAPLGPDGAGGDGAGLLADDVDLEAGGTGDDDGAPRARRPSLMQTVSTGLQRSASLLSRAAMGAGGPTRTASLLNESALLTASSDGDDGDESSVSGSGGAPGRDTRRMSLWSLAGDAPEMPPEENDEPPLTEEPQFLLS